ncbi:MAG: hypothetical protein P8K77_05365 [Polaribacter sp.]|nr:hypothetical protein [Polaribacter sp.]
MRKLNLIICLLFLVSCGEGQNKKVDKKSMNTNMMTYQLWKKSVVSTLKVTDFQREILESVIKDITSNQFNRLTGAENKIKEPIDSFFVFEYSEGEIVSYSLNYFIVGENNFLRRTIRFEYGESTLEEKEINKSITVNDFLKTQNEELVDSSEFILVTRNSDSKVLSSINHVNNFVEDLLY